MGRLRYVVLGFGVLVVIIVGIAIAVGVLTTKEFGSQSPEQRAVTGLGANILHLVTKGAVTGRGDVARNTVRQIKFRLTNTKASQSVRLAPSGTRVTYLDKNQLVRPEYASAGGPTPHWSHTWVRGRGDGIEPDELVEFTLDVSGLDPPLRANTTFKIEIVPSDGPVATVERTTPPAITVVMDMG